LEEPVLFKLAEDAPVVRNAGDVIALLRGVWLEILPHGDVRISPLLSDITNDVPRDEGKKWRQLAAVHWLGTKTLNERTLPLCFWNAFLGEHDWVLLKLSEVMQTMDPDKLRAAAPILASITILATDKPLYPANALVGLYLRMLQFI